MKRYKVAFIVGARPQLVKLAPVYHTIKTYLDIDPVIIHTGQHYDASLSDHFFEEFKMPYPDYNLGVGSGTPAYQFSQIIKDLAETLLEVKPHLMVVIGDTNSTAAAAICGAINSIPIAHIESGLREFNRNVPEEINKWITDAVAELYFCPTKTAMVNLQKEGVASNLILSGDPSLDMLFEADMEHLKYHPIFNQLGIEHGKYYFATMHRQLNTSSAQHLKEILESFAALDHPVIFPIHPRTRQAIDHFQLTHLLAQDNIQVLLPIGYWPTQALIRFANKILTDSGGIIKEAYFHNQFVIILDTQTEWVEVVSESKGIITGPDRNKILEACKLYLPEHMSNESLGSGNASALIAKGLYDFLKIKYP